MLIMENSRKKRKLIINNIKSGLDNIQPLCEGIKIYQGKLTFRVPSKSELDINHNVFIDVNGDGEVELKCDCQNRDCESYCTHINSSIIFFLTKFLNTAQKGSDNNKLYSEIDSMINNFNLKIN